MDALCKCMFIRAWRLCFKGHICFSKNLLMYIRHMKKETPGSHYFSLHWAIYRHKPVLHFCRTVQLTSEHAKCIYPILFIIAFVCLSVHTLEGDTGVNSQTSPVPLPQKLISSRPNPMKKLGENPVPFHSRKNDSHSLPLPVLFFFFFLPKSVSYSKNIVQITACPPY